eukprot:COSAG01_NODE_27396_length_687_cov_0.581633_1_plen_22_part_01
MFHVDLNPYSSQEDKFFGYQIK